MFTEAPDLAHRPPHQRTGRARVFDLLSAGQGHDRASRGVDVAIVAAIVLTLASVLLGTVDAVAASIGWLLDTVLVLAVLGFTAEYALRLWACTCEEEFEGPIEGRLRYATTPLALVDALALLPFYLALLAQILTLGSAEFSSIVQLFLLLLVLKLARYSTALRTLGRVLHARRGELGAVLIIDVVLLLGVSSAMYVVEGDVQPEAFSSIPQTMFWGLITMSTVGYGDITPATQGGRLIAGLAALLGVAMFALPAGVLGAGFTEAFQEAREDEDDDGGACRTSEVALAAVSPCPASPKRRRRGPRSPFVDEHRLGPEDRAKLEADDRARRLPPETVVDLLAPQPGMQCLDLGAGTGYLARPLAESLEPGTVVALDHSQRMLADLRQRARGSPRAIHTVQGSATQLPFRRASFARVLSVNLHHEVDDRGTMLAEVLRVLEQGGHMLVVDWAPIDTDEGPPVDHRLSAQQIADELREAGFAEVVEHDVFDQHTALEARRSTRP